MHNLDLLVQNYFYLNHTPDLTQFMYILSGLFDPSLAIVSAIFFCAVLIYLTRGQKFSILFVSTLVFGFAVVHFLKDFIGTSRPEDGIVSAMGQSFPSGHTTIATIFFVMIAYIFRQYTRGFWGHFLNIFCFTCILLVGFSRIYLGVHWLSDVLGGIGLGAALSYTSIKVFKKIPL